MWELTLVIVGAMLGFLLGVVPGIVRHGFAMVGYCNAARDVMGEVCECAEIYLKDGYKAPLYRVPADYFRDAFSALLYQGGLKSSEASALLRFGSQADQLNRGLNQINQHLTDDHKSLVHRENVRLLIKATQLVPLDVALAHTELDKAKESLGDSTIYDAAKTQIDILCDVAWYRWILR